MQNLIATVGFALQQRDPLGFALEPMNDCHHRPRNRVYDNNININIEYRPIIYHIGHLHTRTLSALFAPIYKFHYCCHRIACSPSPNQLYNYARRTQSICLTMHRPSTRSDVARHPSPSLRSVAPATDGQSTRRAASNRAALRPLRAGPGRGRTLSVESRCYSRYAPRGRPTGSTAGCIFDTIIQPSRNN